MADSRKTRLLFVVVMSCLFASSLACGRREAAQSNPTARLAAGAILGEQVLAKSPHASAGLPQLRTEREQILLSRKGYVLSYAPSRRGLNWAAWRLQASDLGMTERQNNFAIDAELSDFLASRGESAVRSTEYIGSCYDRGHQVPSGDRTLTVDANRATFKMSNMMPQTPYLNRVLWQRLESYSRDLVQDGRDLLIIAGGVFRRRPGAIGPEHDIQVPDSFFKIIVDLGPKLKAEKVLVAVLIPNVDAHGFQPVDLPDGPCPDDEKAIASAQFHGAVAEQWQDYETSVATIEALSGLNLGFLAELD